MSETVNESVDNPMKAQTLHEGRAGKPPCGYYEELSPREFNRRKELVVLLVKAPHALGEFQGFRSVIAVEEPQSLPAHLAELPPGQAVGLVCPDGGCSSRLAIRLSNLGHPVYHLGGGLREWYHSFREAREHCN